MLYFLPLHLGFLEFMIAPDQGLKIDEIDTKYIVTAHRHLSYSTSHYILYQFLFYLNTTNKKYLTSIKYCVFSKIHFIWNLRGKNDEWMTI